MRKSIQSALVVGLVAGLSGVGCSGPAGQGDAGGDAGRVDAAVDGGSMGDGTSQMAGFPNRTEGQVELPTAAIVRAGGQGLVLRTATYDGGAALGEKTVFQGAGVPEVKRSGPWLYLFANESPTVYVLDPRKGVEVAHTIDVSEHSVTGVADVAFVSELNKTFVAAETGGTLLSVAHGEDGDEISAIDLSEYDTDGDPDQAALAVHGEGVLVALSRMDGDGSDEEAARPGKVVVVDAEDHSIAKELELPHSDLGPGFSQMGDTLTVAAVGKEEEEGGGGFKGAAKDGAIYALQGQQAATLSVGDAAVTEETVGTHVRSYEWLDSTRMLVFGGLLEPNGSVVSGLDGDSPSVEPLDDAVSQMGDGRLWGTAICRSADGQFVGVGSRASSNRGGKDAFLVLDGSTAELRGSGEVELEAQMADCAWFGD